jgi:flagellar protein FliS
MNEVKHGARAYSKASHTVGKTRQIVMLYDGMIRLVQQAAEAIEHKDFETRYNKLSRVTEIIIGLQASLDFEAGGSTAQVLYDYYAALELRIYPIHHSNDIAACQSVIADLKTMRDVWHRIDQGEVAAADTARAIEPVSVAAPESGESHTVSA